MPYLKGSKVAGRVDFYEIEVSRVRDRHVNANANVNVNVPAFIHLLYMTRRIEKEQRNKTE